MKLNPEQIAKIARLWVPRPGHLYVDPDDHRDWWRVIEVTGGEVTRWIDSDDCVLQDGEGVAEGDEPWPEGMVPCFWGDDATADGLPRVARAAWRDEHAYAMWSQAGKWKVFVHHFGLVTVYEGRTEADAWLAAILAAPEEK